MPLQAGDSWRPAEPTVHRCSNGQVPENGSFSAALRTAPRSPRSAAPKCSVEPNRRMARKLPAIAEART